MHGDTCNLHHDARAALARIANDSFSPLRVEAREPLIDDTGRPLRMTERRRKEQRRANLKIAALSHRKSPSS